MPIPPRRRSSRAQFRPAAAPPVGIVIAAVVAVVILIAVALTAVLSNNGRAAGPEIDDTAPPAPDILDLGGTDIEGMFIQLVDEDDPTRVAGEILAASFEPIDPSNREVVEPRAWFFLDDGRTAYIEADEGRFFIPVGTSRPEEGVLRGNVRVRLFDAKPNARRPDPSRDAAALDAQFAEPLRFDLRLGELSSPGRLEVTGDTVEFAGTEVRAVLNQTRGRITLLEVTRGERLVYKPPATDGTDTAFHEHTPRTSTPSYQPVSSSVAFTRVQSEAPTPSSPPTIDLYRAVFFDGVVAEQTGRSVRADRLDVWVRLFDRSLAPRDTADTTDTPRPTITQIPAAWRGTLTDLVLAAALAQATDPNTNTDTNTDDRSNAFDETAPLTLTWTGRLRLDSLDETAPLPELTDENLALRFTAEQTGLVEFADASTGANGTAVALEYNDSAQRIRFRGTAGTVQLTSPDAGRIDGVSRMDIALDLGNVNVRGPGVLYAAEHQTDNPNAGPRRAIRWTDQADFDFAVADGRMTDTLEQARFLGRVQAFGDAAELTGTAITAVFESATDETERANTRLSLLRVTEASSNDGRGGTLNGDTMRVFFDTESPESDVTPTRVIIEGSAIAARNDGASLAAERIDAALDREPSGRIIVAEAEAEGDVRFADGRDITGQAHRLEARPPFELATLLGTDDVPALVNRGTGAISGPRIDLDGRSGTLDVRGPGTLSEADTTGERGARRTIELAWSEGLAFDDPAGDVQVTGSVTGSLRSINEDGVLAIDRLAADRVAVDLEPTDAGTQTDTAETGDRVRAVTVYAGRGRSADLARVEARRYAPNTTDDSPADQAVTPEATSEEPPGQLLRVLALDGREIQLIAATERVIVPGPGRLVSLQNPTNSPADDSPTTQAARVLVEWIGGMELDRQAGIADLFNRVAVVHHRPDTAVTSELESETLRLVFRERESAEGELVELDAAGAAWLRSGVREMLADRILYNADTGLARATAEAANRVTLFEGARGTPISAAQLEWDLFRDQITITRPTGIAAPQ
ncbi:MAG: hypothetical protein AAF297_07285 [Planctomycetota bacterium]